LEISHPSFSQTYYCVRNHVNGVTVTLETAAVVDFVYYPMQITRIGVQDDLDQSLHVELGDLGAVLPRELDNIAADDTFHIKPIIKYRSYRSDNLDEPMTGPITLEVKDFKFTKEGAAFDAKAPQLNINRTGELYSIDRFPMLRGFI
jgi:hypothetical protein